MDVILAVENFGDNKKVLIKDVDDESKLLGLLYKLDTQEVSLTKNGLNYLTNHYGLDKIANMILKEIENGVDYKYTEKEQIKQWLINEAK